MYLNEAVNRANVPEDREQVGRGPVNVEAIERSIPGGLSQAVRYTG